MTVRNYQGYGPFTCEQCDGAGYETCRWCDGEGCDCCDDGGGSLCGCCGGEGKLDPFWDEPHTRQTARPETKEGGA